MKKITLIFIVFLIVFLQFPLYMQYNVSEIEGYLIENCSYMDIKSAGTINSSDRFYKAVSEYTMNSGATIFSVSYEAQSDSSEKMTLYVSGNKYPDFFNQINISNDEIKQIQNDDAINKPLFNPNKSCDICNFKALKDKSLSRTYYVYPAEKGNEFKIFLEDNYDVVFFTSDELLYINSKYMEQIPGAAIMFIALMVFWAFWIVNEYQLNAVKKLQGFSDFNCGYKLYCDFVTINLIAIIIVQVIQLIICGLYNNLTNYQSLFYDSIENSAKIFVAATIAGLIVLLLFYNSNVNYALKGKRPTNLLLSISAILKIITIIFLCASVFTISDNIANTSITLKQTERFNEISNYRSPEFRLTSGSGEYIEQFENNASEFYKRINGVLISDRNLQKARLSIGEEDNIEDNTIYINNEYLRLNPIYDSSDNVVIIDEKDISSNEIIVLVPEKYRNCEEEIYTKFVEWYKFARYVTNSSENNLNVIVEILFVKEEQTYFAYNTELEQIEHNYITDPFAVIVTNDNMDDSYYANFLLNSEMLLIDNLEQTADEIFLTAKESGIFNDLSNLPTIGSKVDNIMQHSKNKTIMYSVILIVSIFIVCLISSYIIKCYVYQNRKLFFVKKMSGYSFWSIYGKFISLVLIVQIILFIAIKFFMNISFSHILIVLLLFNSFDFGLMTIISLRYYSKISKDVLKGE